MRSRELQPWIFFCLLWQSAWGCGAALSEEPDPSPERSVEMLVRQALEAELKGEPERREASLAAALKFAPGYAPARWHSGHVLAGDEWLPVDMALQQTAVTGRVSEYRNLRERYADTAAGQVALARWCRKNQLADREKLHWSIVLSLDPSNREARGRLAVRKYRGRLFTKEQIDLHMQWQEEYDKAMDYWKPRLVRYQKAIEDRDPIARDRALAELRAVDDPSAIPALEAVFSKAGGEESMEVIRILGRINDRRATESLIRHALAANSPELRVAAAEELRKRSQHGFVPAMLGSFHAPATLSYYVSAYRDFAGYGFRLVREGVDGDVVVERSHSSNYPNRGLGGPFRYTHGGPLPEARSYQVKLTSLAREVERIDQWNSRVAAALQLATGQQLGDDPQAWLQWWQTQNELQTVKKKPTLYFGQQTRALHFSCFLAGTQVSTDAGYLAIEKVRPGDRVLSQHPETGELAYRLVLDRTVRPPSPSLRLRCGEEEIVATLGHPMWVTGKGWRMTKEIEVGDLLHGVQGSVPVDAIEPGPEAEAYNLVVADFNTYFIGKHRVLVHDNQNRSVTDAVLPGLVLNSK